MSKFRLIYSLVSLALVAAGFTLSFWPLSLLGLLVAVVMGQYVLAVALGIFLDGVYGQPTVGYLGYLHLLRVPFMLFSIALCALHYYIAFYFREGNTGRL